jgi:hypothetical protein
MRNSEVYPHDLIIESNGSDYEKEELLMSCNSSVVDFFNKVQIRLSPNHTYGIMVYYNGDQFPCFIKWSF